MLATKSLFFAFFFCLTILLPAQNLLDDGRHLLDALKTMETAPSSQLRKAAAEKALLILYLYNEPSQIEPPSKIDPVELLENVSNNPLLSSIIQPQHDSLFRALGTMGPSPTSWSDMQTAKRARISSLMYGDAPLSPSQYLSVKQSLQNSQLPPLQNASMMNEAADKINTPPSVNNLRAEAILKGLFAFILERAQQEVAINFFENLLNKKVPQVGFLFPNVRERYNNPEISYSQSFIESLREAFFLDLKNLNVTLPQLMLKDEYFGALQQDPVYFNLLTVYTMFGLSVNDVPLNEILPLTHRDLFENYQMTGRNLNQYLADSASAYTSLEYKQVIAGAKAFIKQLDTVYILLNDAEFDIETRISNLQVAHSGEPSTPLRENFLAKPTYNYALLIGEADTTMVFNLGFLPQLLEGALNDEDIAAYNTLEAYDKFFDPPFSATQLRTAGLELTRNLGGNWYNDLSLPDLLRRWQTDLAAYELAIEEWQSQFDTLSLNQQLAKAEEDRQILKQLIIDTRSYWSLKSEKWEVQPLIQLEAIAADFGVNDFFAASKGEKVALRKVHLTQIEKRLIAFEKRLKEKYKVKASDSPLKKYLTRPVITRPSDKILKEINKLDDLGQSLQQYLAQLDTTHAPGLKAAWRNNRPLLQLTELMSHLMYVLQSPDTTYGLLTLSELDSALHQPALRKACLGLLQQRLSQIKNVGLISPEAIAQVARLTLGDLINLQSSSAKVDSGDNKRLYKVLSIVINTFDRIMQYPLFADPAKPLVFTSFISRSEALKILPKVSKNCMDFLYYLEMGQNRAAVSSLVRLMTTLSKHIVDKDKKCKNGKDQNGKKCKQKNDRAVLLKFFSKYGDFVAGMVDAKSKGEVESLLKSIADPPGSSRLKRTQEMTLGINAYLGASVGSETWERKQLGLAKRSDFTTVVPSIPVGFTFSNLFGDSYRHPQSFSLHISIIDLGAMLTYRLDDEDEFGSYKLTFKNVLRPGFQIHWNIQKSPFYVGIGWQTGPQFRIENEREIAVRSSRAFLTFGVDVPIKTLYQR